MKIAIPTEGDKGLDEQVAEHFGRAPTYTIVDEKSDGLKVLPNTSNHMGGYKHPPELLADEGVEVLVCRGLGRRAVQMFEEKGIKVYCEAAGTVKDALEQLKNASLTIATEDTACEQHAFRSHEHGEHHHNHEH